MFASESRQKQKTNVQQLNIHNRPAPQLMQEGNETTGGENILERTSMEDSKDEESYFHVDTVVSEIVQNGQDLDTFINQVLILSGEERGVEIVQGQCHLLC